MNKIVGLRGRERDRLAVLRQVRQGKLTQASAAERMELSERWVKKLMGRLRTESDREAAPVELGGDAAIGLGRKGRRDPLRDVANVRRRGEARPRQTPATAARRGSASSASPLSAPVRRFAGAGETPRRPWPGNANSPRARPSRRPSDPGCTLVWPNPLPSPFHVFSPLTSCLIFRVRSSDLRPSLPRLRESPRLGRRRPPE